LVEMKKLVDFSQVDDFKKDDLGAGFLSLRNDEV